MSRGRPKPHAQSELARAEYVLRRDVAHDSADALAKIMYIYDGASVEPLRRCVAWLMLPWWKRLLTAKPDFKAVHDFKVPTPEELAAMQETEQVLAAKAAARGGGK